MIHSTGIERQLVTTESDQRFTPIGLLLRRWKLDELPQLMNVLWGDMSIVGPRPKVREHRISILPCRPGITGAATITFADEETLLARVSKHHLDLWYQSVVLPAKSRLDSEYMERATFLSDLKLIVRSVLRRWDSSAIEGLFSKGALETEDRMDRSNTSVPAVALSPREQPDWPQVRATELAAGAERPAILATD
jgi:lipopolysaccharide/colanic/teichoic acid biosynthesis glycosyltransferase